MYEKINQEIHQEYYQQNFSNDGQRFVAWFLRNIHMRDPNQAKYDITDGQDDKQIDAVVVDDTDSTVYIVQGKFIGADKVDAEPLREVLSSWLQLKNLTKLQENANEKLKVRLKDLSDALEDEYEVNFELITTAALSESAKNDLKVFQETIAKDEDLSASLTVVDNDELHRRYELALEQESPLINYSIPLEDGKYLSGKIAGTEVVIAAVQLKDCIKIPGIKDGSLFRKNVRQFMGLSNQVNKSIKSTIYSDKNMDFFFYHNGITAICDKMNLRDNTLNLSGLSVVNGCQSLNTILACSERTKELNDSYIMFRFYEIPQRDRADKISVSTNLQSAVKPRDLRSNDKRVLNLKRLFEQKYQNGYFITKRAEIAPAEKDKNYVIDLVDLGKYLISWHSQRPNVAYSETKIFDKYFEQLFKREYDPENIQALNFWMQMVKVGWTPENKFGLNESLLAMKAYVPYHVLFAISQFFSIASNFPDRVPQPKAALKRARENKIEEQIVKRAARCLNLALSTATKQQPPDRIFSPQNWIKTKTCLSGIENAVSAQLMAALDFSGGKELNEALKIPIEEFEYRWEAAD